MPIWRPVLGRFFIPGNQPSLGAASFMSGHPERTAFSIYGPGKGPFSSMPGKGGREPVMADAEDGKNGQQGQQGQGGEPDPVDYKAKENQGASDEPEKLKAENLSEIEKAQQRAKAAEEFWSSGILTGSQTETREEAQGNRF